MEQRRRNRTLGRKKGTKSSRQTVYIICEGLKTEPNYFRFMKSEWGKKFKRVDNFIHITIRDPKHTGGTSPDKIIDYAIELRQQLPDKNSERGSDFDIWCVFDVEAMGTHPNLKNTIARSKRNDIKVAISNPAFEYWLLLHFSDSTRRFANCNEVMEILKKKGNWPSYCKGLDDFTPLKTRYDKAMSRACIVRKNAPPPQGSDPVSRPWTNVDELIRFLEEMLEPPYNSPRISNHR